MTLAVVSSLCFHACALQAADAGPNPAAPHLTLLEAVRLTLLQDAHIQGAQQQVEFAKGAVQIAGGQFDLTLQSALSRELNRVPRSQLDFVQEGFVDIAERESDIATYELRLKKQLRSGITLSPGLEVTRFTDNLFQERAVNRANVSFLIRVPLLKGWGRAATEAGERAARATQEAAVLDLQQTIALRILNTAAAFWQCLAAQHRLQILRESEQQSANLLRAVRDLVNIQELPASELRQTEADQAAKATERITGEHEFWQAREQLAQAIGLAPDLMALPPVPAADFPAAVTNLSGWSPAELSESLARRPDYLAALKVQSASEILEAAARQNLKPQLDLNLAVGYAGLDEGSQLERYYGSLDPRLAPGPNLLGTVSFEWPFGNRAARGALAQRQAVRQQSHLRAQELARTIHSGILVAFSELTSSQGEIEQADAAAQSFRRAVQSEQDKVRLGTGTILDVITLADRLHEARLRGISARARYGTALARVRYETGWLIQPGTTLESPLTVQDLVTLPPRSSRGAER